MSNGKLFIFSAPSGSGKTTIVRELMQDADLNLKFSVSATSRKPRHTESNGVDYHFLTPDEFRAKVDSDEFLEWEEVYADNYYGTLKAEVDNLLQAGFNVVFDVDVVGGLNIKKFYDKQALAVFVQPPSIKELEARLKGRATDDEATIKRRIDKAEYELSFADKFDCIVVNDNLQEAIKDTKSRMHNFLA